MPDTVTTQGVLSRFPNEIWAPSILELDQTKGDLQFISSIVFAVDRTMHELKGPSNDIGGQFAQPNTITFNTKDFPDIKHDKEAIENAFLEFGVNFTNNWTGKKDYTVDKFKEDLKNDSDPVIEFYGYEGNSYKVKKMKARLKDLYVIGSAGIVDASPVGGVYYGLPRVINGRLVLAFNNSNGFASSVQGLDSDVFMASMTGEMVFICDTAVVRGVAGITNDGPTAKFNLEREQNDMNSMGGYTYLSYLRPPENGQFGTKGLLTVSN